MLTRIPAVIGCTLTLGLLGLAWQDGPAKAGGDKSKATTPPPKGAEARVGEKVPPFTLPSPLNSDGRTTLEELRGQPVYIDWWGTH